MPNKTLRVTLEIDVADLPPKERKELAQQSGGHLPRLKDYEPLEAADVLYGIAGGCGGELFAGSDVFLDFKAVSIVSAEWA